MAVTIRPCWVPALAIAVLVARAPTGCADPPRLPPTHAIAAFSAATASSHLTNTSTTSGEPQGFNIQLIRALAREAGMSIEIRLGLREERMKEFDAGKTDVMFLSYSEERAARYQLLDQTWTLAQVVDDASGSAPLSARPRRSVGRAHGGRQRLDQSPAAVATARSAAPDTGRDRHPRRSDRARSSAAKSTASPAIT